METPRNSERARPSGWPRAVLYASLALNLLFVGIFVGLVVNGPPRHPDRADPALPYARALDAEQRRAVMRDLRRGMIADRRALRGAFAQDYASALDILRRDPFDPAALEALLARQAVRGAEVRSLGQQALLQHISGLSRSERLAYADRLEEELAHFRRRAPVVDRRDPSADP